MTKQINFSNPGEIDPTKVKQAVFSKIDFPLAEDWWDQIEAAFRHCWNVDIGIRGVIYEDQIEKYVYEQLRKNDLLITSDQVNEIIGIMLHYIETSGGYLDVGRNGMKDIENIIFNEEWDKVLEELKKDKSLISTIDPADLAWKRFQYQLAENGVEEWVSPFGKIVNLLKVINLFKVDFIM